MNNTGNYAKHAQFWDWGGYDRTGEFESWRAWAAEYGENVLIPFCALSEAGAYMARRGTWVTAFDLTPEMIVEGKKRFRGAHGLRLLEGDVTDFRFDIPPVDFCFATDFGHIHTAGDIQRTLACIHRHLRPGGALVIEAAMPAKRSSCTPQETFYPKEQVYPGIQTGSTRHDAKRGRCYILQIVWIEGVDSSMEQFDHSFYLQHYPRKVWLAALHACGFDRRGEYRNYDREPYRKDDGLIIIEAIKTNGGIKHA